MTRRSAGSTTCPHLDRRCVWYRRNRNSRRLSSGSGTHRFQEVRNPRTNSWISSRFRHGPVALSRVLRFRTVVLRRRSLRFCGFTGCPPFRIARPACEGRKISYGSGRLVRSQEPVLSLGPPFSERGRSRGSDPSSVRGLRRRSGGRVQSRTSPPGVQPTPPSVEWSRVSMSRTCPARSRLPSYPG
jgi:hypothetical protein